MKCGKHFDISEGNDQFVCITPGLFLCQEHYMFYINSKQFDANFLGKYQQKKKENFIKEMFWIQTYKDAIPNCEKECICITSDIAENTFSIDRPYDLFLPTITLWFNAPISKIDLDNLLIILGEDAVIFNIEQGIKLKIALLLKNNLKKIHEFADKINSSFLSRINTQINLPNDVAIQNTYKKSTKFLNNESYLNKNDIETMTEKVLEYLLQQKIKNKWDFVLQYHDIFDNAEKQILADILNCPFEIIVTDLNVIANNHINEFEEVKKKISLEDQKIKYLYHLSNFNNYQIDKNSQFDSGYFGVGIYATDNVFFATTIENNFHKLKKDEKVHIIFTKVIYNKAFLEEIVGKALDKKSTEPKIAKNYGVHHVFVGNSENFPLIPNSPHESISANEYIFQNRSQIIPILSLSIMRTDHYILWKGVKSEDFEKKLDDDGSPAFNSEKEIVLPLLIEFSLFCIIF